MSFRRVFIPVALVLTLLMLFVPGTIFAPRPVAATSTSYDFIANACAASWSTGAGAIACPGTVANPQLENGAVSSTPGLVINPQAVTGGYIQAVFPAYTVQAGDHFQTIVNCAYNYPSCYVNFRLKYQIGSGPVLTFWSFNERYDGLFFHANINLSSLAGQTVNFILYIADVSGHGTPSGDKAEWVGTQITNGSGVPYVPPSSICNLGLFIGDVTIPDGTVVAPGQAFTKTWEIENVGTCTWTTSYSLVYLFGNPFGAASPEYLPASVPPGATANFSVNMVAPSVAGHYRSYWRFRDASGNQFGVGSGMITFFADINVSSSAVTTATTTSITAHTPNPSIPAQAVSVSVSVAGSGATPTGTVAISGADSNCTVTLSGGSGNCNVIFNTIGAKTISAVYSGDGFNASSSTSVSHTVSTAITATTTTITGHTPNPSVPGQAVSVSVTVAGSGATPTGTVAITGADSNCTITLSGGGGNCNVTFNSNGAKTISAVYSGDGTNAGSSTSANHNVNTVPSTTTITGHTPNPSTPGQSVAVTVTVSGSSGTPTGTVAITGADGNCTITLTAGSGTCNVSFNTAGAKTLTATYNGNSTYAVSSTTASHTVNKGSTATVITSNSPNPAATGQAVTVNVTVSGGGPTPTGTVSITGADTNCTITLSAGSGSCNTVVFNTPGAKTLTATYNGDGNYEVSSGTASETVVPAKLNPKVKITGDVPDPSAPGQTVVVGVSVTSTGTTPTGTVAITGADNNCNITLDSSGDGSCNVVFMNTGAKTLTATYSGDTNYNGGTDTEKHTVTLGPSTTVITADNPDPSIPGQSVAVSVTVTGAGAIPTGTVLITGADTQCTLTLASGSGSCNVVFNTVGSKTITATYSGDMNYVGSSDTEEHTVIQGPSTLIITSDSPNPSAAGGTVWVHVTVGGSGATPTGTVTLTSTPASAFAPYPCTITLVGGTGSCSIVFSSTGPYVINAVYSGDVNYTGSSTTENHVVN